MATMTTTPTENADTATMRTIPTPTNTKDRIVVALDVPDRQSALSLVEQVSGLVGMFKIGNQLFTAEGPELVREIVRAGERVFLRHVCPPHPSDPGDAVG